MDKVKFPSKVKVYVPLLILFVALFAFMPRTRKFSYDYKKGAPWMYETLVSQFDFPILKTESEYQQEKQQAQADVVPYFKMKQGVLSEIILAVKSVDFGQYEQARNIIIKIVENCYPKGVINGSDELENSSVAYIQVDKRASQVPVSEIYTISEIRHSLNDEISGFCSNPDSLLRSSGVLDILSANLFLDEQTTSLLHESSSTYVSPTSGMVSSGTVIVSKGEIVTSEIHQLLDSYKAEYDSNYGYYGKRVFLYVGNAFLSLILVLLLFFCINYTYSRIFLESSSYHYLLLIFLLSSVAAFTLETVNPELLYLFPFALMGIYLIAFFKKRVVLPVYILSLLPLLIFAHNGVELFLMYLFAGVVSIFTFSYFNKGWLQFINALCMFASLIFVFVTFRMVEGTAAMFSYRLVLYLFLGSMCSVALYPLIYLFEKLFSLVSTSRLIELSDTNNKLLQDLAAKAPGTFQHSLQVMNLAEAVGRAIDADVPLLRCGALYHDVGKILNPQCFVENERTGAPKYHAELSPVDSARDIVKHVPDGYALAEKNRIPSVVRDFILSHHGTSSAGYFYSKYLQDGGDDSMASEFFYDGKKPKTTEQIILMICDSVEAASRTLKDYNETTISSLVDQIVSAKMEDGQFDEAPISIKELIKMKDVLKNRLGQMYHERIAYPSRSPRKRIIKQ